MLTLLRRNPIPDPKLIVASPVPPSSAVAVPGMHPQVLSVLRLCTYVNLFQLRPACLLRE